MPNSRSRRVRCAHDGCPQTFLRPHKAGRPRKYCSIECRTKAATARRAARAQPQGDSRDQVLREIKRVSDQVAVLINAPSATTPPPAAAPPPPAETVDLADMVRTACLELRELTDYLAANPGSTQALGIMNRAIDRLSNEANRRLDTSPTGRNPG